MITESMTRIRITWIRLKDQVFGLSSLERTQFEFICYNGLKIHNKLASSVERLRKKEIKMVTTRFDIEKFSGKTDVGLWRIKMKALLVHQGLADTLKGDSGESSTTDGEESSPDAVEKAKMMEKAHSAIILYLGDKALMKVSKESKRSMG
ncbi:hypothetical protein ACS0TY_006743 [Phlomoides rotata]